MEKIKLKDIIEWDVVNWSSILNYWEKFSRTNFRNSVALELGGRNGGLSLWFALKGSKIICSDLKGPSENASLLHKKYNVSNLIDYRSINALDIPFKDYFDILVFKSILGGIGRNNMIGLQQRVVDQIYKTLKPGGELFFAENLTASPLHRFFRQRFVKWGSEWRYVTISEMKEFLSIFTSYQFITVGFLGAFGRKEWQRNLLGWFDRLLFNHIAPESWRYIIIGIAKK